MMVLKHTEPEDAGVCVNYITEEYSTYSGSVDTKYIALVMEQAIAGKHGIKVELDGVIVGFAYYEDFGVNMLIVSLVVNREYRIGKATWLIFKELLRLANGRKLVYIPIHKNMVASKLCSKGLIDSTKAKEWVTKLESRWGV